jgi:hypothetical protein
MAGASRMKMIHQEVVNASVGGWIRCATLQSQLPSCQAQPEFNYLLTSPIADRTRFYEAKTTSTTAWVRVRSLWRVWFAGVAV